MKINGNMNEYYGHIRGGQTDWESGKTRNKRWRVLMALLLLVIILGVIYGFVIGVSKIDGNSMYPTFKNGQVVWYLKLDRSCDPGDVVSIKMPDGSKYIKRVIAVAGDQVDIRKGNIYVNGVRLTEDYVLGRTYPEQGYGEVEYPYTVEPNKYFVLGDNREHSVDSRAFGSVDRSQILGTLMRN